MKIYCGGRANGKTMKAIQLSVEKQMPIICWSYEHKKQIEQTAKKMNAKWIIPEPILATEVRKKVIGNRRGLIVDDLDILLRMILDDNVYYATIEDCNIEELRRSDTNDNKSYIQHSSKHNEQIRKYRLYKFRQKKI